MGLFRGRKSKGPEPVLCPYCTNMVVPTRTKKKLEMYGEMMVEECPTCGSELPKGLGIHDPQKAVILSGIGFKEHGKTVYMASLFHVMCDILQCYWPGYYVEMPDDDSFRTVNSHIEQLVKHRKVPDRTEASFPKPTIVLQKQASADGRPEFEVSTLFYDTGGESFVSGRIMQQNARYMTRARTALFIAGLPQLLHPARPGADLWHLLNSYCVAMKGLGADLSLQQLVVVYTKADWVLDQLPVMIQDYLADGASSYPRPRDLPSYLKRMEEVSSELCMYTERVLGARNFRNMADQFERVRFCAVSALGSAPVNGRLVTDISPCRVLDPFLWAMNAPGTQRKGQQKRRWFGR